MNLIPFVVKLSRPSLSKIKEDDVNPDKYDTAEIATGVVLPKKGS